MLTTRVLVLIGLVMCGAPAAAQDLLESAPRKLGLQATRDAASQQCRRVDTIDAANLGEVALERTFQEWKGTLFSIQPHGQSCAQCHMAGSDGPASVVSTRTRRLHNHEFPAVDVPLRHLDGVPAALVGEQVPDAPAATDGVEAQLSLAGLFGQEVEDRLGTGAGSPLGFGHGRPSITPSPARRTHSGHAIWSGRSRDGVYSMKKLRLPQQGRCTKANCTLSE